MDAALQSATQNQNPPQTDAERVAALERLNYLQDNYITFCASSGISQDEDGNFTSITVKEFAAAAGVHRVTLYKWQKSIPNFWQRVDQRAKEIFNQSTKYAIFKGLKMKAMMGDVKAAEMVLSHFSDYTPPAQKHEVKLSGWGDMVREARKRQIKSNRPAAEPIEAELVEDNPPQYQGTVAPQSPLPQPSTVAQPQPEIATSVSSSPPQPPEHINSAPAPQGAPIPTQPQPIIV